MHGPKPMTSWETQIYLNGLFNKQKESEEVEYIWDELGTVGWVFLNTFYEVLKEFTKILY